MRIHPVFHVSLLEPAPRNAKTQEEITIEEETYEVDKILAEKQSPDKKMYYLIKWKGYNSKESTWEPIENLAGAPEVLERYRRRHPSDRQEIVQDWRITRQVPQRSQQEHGIPVVLA